MADFSHVNDRPGSCGKCSGSGCYGWGAVVNGKPEHEGTCWSCQGTGRQDRRQMSRNRAFNRYQERRIFWG